MVKVIKKVFAILLALALTIFCLAGCNTKESIPIDSEQTPQNKSNLVFVEKTLIDDFGSMGLYGWIVYDRETKVMYLITYVYESGVAITVMVDEEGNPRLYKG